MIGVARPSKPFTRGVDCLAPMANNVARMFRADGYEFVGRYLENLTADERDGIFAANLGILLLTEATIGLLDADVGTSRGNQSVKRAIALEAPPTLHIVIDLESAKGDPVAVYVDAFHEALVKGTYDSMLYVGADQPLDANQLFALQTTRYFRSGSHVPVPQCDWCCNQLRPLDQIIHGQRVDFDIIEADCEGRTPTLWYPS
jgi:hypothetical protein